MIWKSAKKLNVSLFEKFTVLQVKLKSSVELCETEYYKKISQKYIKPENQCKCYCNLFETLSNGKNSCIPQLFVDHTFVVDFQEKTKFLTLFLKISAY